MPQRWTIREPGREWHIYRRFDAPATRLASKDDVIARWPRWVSDPASKRVLADLYRELIGPNLGQPDLGETLKVRERIEHAFRSQELVVVCVVSAIEVGGQPAPAREIQPAPAPPPPTERGPKYEIEFRTPHDGDIFLVGDKVKVQAVVLENGAETDRPVSYSASRGSVRNSWVLLDVSGSHEIVAENSEVSVRDSIRITAVLPWVSRVESTGPELYKPYDHKSKSRKPGLIEWVLGQKRSTTLVPTVTKMGQEVRLTLSVRGSAPLPLSRKTEVEMFFGSVGSMDDTETEYASKPFGNQPIRWRGTGTLQGLNAEERVTLAADRPFPNRIVRFRWLKRWRYRVKWPDGAWSHPGEDPDPWRPLEGPPEFFAYTVWKAPILSGLSSLKETEYDHFHIDKACLFAEGAFHLKLCGAWSIPFKADNRMGHYRWSDSLEDPEHEYRFFGGADPPKPQFKPANSAELRTHPDSLHYPDMESAAMKEFNLGWNLLDNRKGAGGRCNQQATLIAAILNTLGIRAQMRHFRSRGRWSGGLIDAGKNRHDPVTLRAPCFDDKHGSPTCDYGWNFHGICLVDTEGAEPELTEYDGSFSSPYTGSWPPSPCDEDHLFGRRVGRKHSLKSSAIIPTHDLRPPAEREGNRCRCGHEIEVGKGICTCGAQPTFRYRCSQCGEGRLRMNDRDCPNCRKRLKALYAECLISPCPKCKRTVHDSMQTCWACSQPLAPVKYLYD